MRPRPLAAHSVAAAFLAAAALASTSTFANPFPTALPAAPRQAQAGPLLRAPAPAFRSAAPLAAGDADGVWQEYGLLQVSDAFSSWDAAGNRLLSIGGSPSRVNYALTLAAPVAWQALPPMSEPAQLWGALIAWDASTGLVYFPDYASLQTTIRALDPLTGVITSITAAGPSPIGFPVVLAFDDSNHRLIVIGFSSSLGYYALETWALELDPAPAWTNLAPTGSPALGDYPPYANDPAVFDPVRHRLLLPGPYPGGVTDMWVLSLDGAPQWSVATMTGLPEGRSRSPMVFDPASDRIWTIGSDGDPWSLSPVTLEWTHEPAVGPPPAPRHRAGVAFDPLNHRLIVHGGVTPSGDDTHSDTWALSLDAPRTWTPLVPDAFRPPIRGGASDGFDASRNRLVVFGGSTETGYFRNDTWGLDLGPTPQWERLSTLGGPPPVRYWHSSAWDEAGDRLVVYGGYSGDSQNPLGDLWTLSFAGGMPNWSEIAPAGPAPVNRMLTSFVYDSARDRFLLLFGFDGLNVRQDVWELRLTPAPAWRQLAPAGAPPTARAAAMCVYDPAQDRVLLFGGSTNNELFNDVWALGLGAGDGTWQPLAIPPGPSRRNLGLLRLDTGHNRLLLFGGFGVSHVDELGNTYIEYLNDTWALDLSGAPGWNALAPAGPGPSGRDRTNGTYDRLRDRLVVACGGIEGHNDLFTLTFGDAPTPTLLALASRDVTADRVRLVWAGADPGESATAYRRAEGAAWASLGGLYADGEGLVTLEDRDVSPGAVFEYRLGVTGEAGEMYFGATLVQVPLRALALGSRVASGRVSFSVELPSGEPASLALFDLAGRRVWSTGVGQLGAGTHEVSVTGAALPPALYFARLVQGAARRDARVVVTR